MSSQTRVHINITFVPGTKVLYFPSKCFSVSKSYYDFRNSLLVRGSHYYSYSDPWYVGASLVTKK